MPQVTVYIREDDLESWKKIEKKSEFISNALNARDFLKQNYPEGLPVKKPIATPMEKIKNIVPDKDICVHGFSKSLRMCKYGC